MTRRGWLWGFVLGGTTRASSATPPVCPEDINQFACLYKAWVDLVWENGTGDVNVVNATEIATWQSVRHAWKKLEKTMNRIYGI